MQTIRHLLNKLESRCFETITKNRLVYNTCWEDPRIDRKLLGISSDSSVVMLTSAGCNALDYLIEDPSSIHAVDSNPIQNELMELKKALFKSGAYSLLYHFLGEGSHPSPELEFKRNIEAFLPRHSRSFWKNNISLFRATSIQPSFYFKGTAGKVAWLLHSILQGKGLYKTVLNLLNATSLAEQAYYFDEIEPELWSGPGGWLVKQSPALAMLGVPNVQRALIKREHNQQIVPYVRKSIRHVFTKVPVNDNYFWRVYLTGSYTRDCCPRYLQKPFFDVIASRINRISTHYSSLISFLQQHPGPYSHYVLLDHQDWLAFSKTDKLEETWKLILENASAGARILFRSAARNVDFLPSFVNQRVQWHNDFAQQLHKKDRVGTYASTQLGIVQ